MKKKDNKEDGIFQFQGKYRIFAKYDYGTGDYIRMPDGMINPSFDDYYLVSSLPSKDEIHHAYDNVFVLYIWSLKRGNRILEELLKIRKDIIIEYEVTDSEVIIFFDGKDIEIINQFIKLTISGADISPTDIRNLPGGIYDIPNNKLEEFSNVYKSVNIPIVKYKKLYLKFIESKTTAKNNALHCFEVSNIPAKNFIYIHGWWNELLSFMKEWEDK